MLQDQLLVLHVVNVQQLTIFQGANLFKSEGLFNQGMGL